MSSHLHLIYVPGIGDTNPKSQILAIKTWRLWGVESELFRMIWANNEKWDSKLNRLLETIDKQVKAGKKVGLVGASAGAGAVINAYALRKNDLVGCVIIAGKVNRPQYIGDHYRKNNPAFIDSAMAAPNSLSSLSSGDLKNVLSIYAVKDEVVQTADSMLPGAINRQVATAGHFLTIASQITLGAPRFIRFLKKRSNYDL
jgi:pimeloyl-ACP methyl ester carboxylesterase